MSAGNLRSTRISLLLAAVVFARALIPAGYMPGGADSGLLFVLCPEGVPAEFMQLLAGPDRGGAHAHHAEHGHDDHQCPVGHMLTSAAAVDFSSAESPESSQAVPSVFYVHSFTVAYRSNFRSRAPPA